MDELPEDIQTLMDLILQCSEVEAIEPSVEEMRKIERDSKCPKSDRVTARLLRELVEAHLRGRQL